jgi:hypothetical protein
LGRIAGGLQFWKRCRRISSLNPVVTLLWHKVCL